MSIFQQLPLVVIESPFRATPYYTEEQHRLYLLHAMEHSLRQGEAPFCSHLIIPEILDDDDPLERALGIKIGMCWGMHADLVAVYSDLGVSEGMKDAIEHWSKLGKRIEWRKLPDRIVAAVKGFGEFNPQGTPDESITPGTGGAAVPFVPD